MKGGLLVRGLLAVLMFYLALHVAVVFNTLFDWRQTIVATEYGHWLALICVALFIPGMRRKEWQARGASLLLVVAGVWFSWPLLQAMKVAHELPEKMASALGGQGVTVSPPDLGEVWHWQQEIQKPPQEFSYFDGPGEPRHILFYAADNRKPAPCLVVLHGGGWQSGSPSEFSEWNNHWASLGYAVACVEYRLAPRHTWPAQLEDTRLALAWLKQNAQLLGIDTTSFVIMGRSAGGQIALASAYGLKDPSIKGCIAIYAPADMSFARRFAYEDDILNSLKLLRQYLGGDPEQVGENYRTSSGYGLATSQSCPTLLIHGSRDVLVWDVQSLRLAERLQSLGVKHYCLKLPWATHGCDWPFHGPSAVLSRYAIEGFLKGTLHPAAPPDA
ncbi:esterase LipC [soil metagenome]